MRANTVNEDRQRNVITTAAVCHLADMNSEGMKRPSKCSSRERLPTHSTPPNAGDVKNPVVIVEAAEKPAATIASDDRSGRSEGQSLARRDERVLTASEFQQLAIVPAEAEWFANIDNKRTRRAYQIDLRDFMSFVGIHAPEEFRSVTRSHVLACARVAESRGDTGRFTCNDSSQACCAVFTL